jgi:carbonic anhydrase/acetyltransferase-like protein (isoleucine patch superfamily)
MSTYSCSGRLLAEAGGAWVADNATITGEVTLGEDVSVWFGSVLRGDDAPITIGCRTNIQDLSMIHADPGVPLFIGEEVTVGHRCILHGALIGDRCLIGMGAILLAGSKVGEGAVVGAGALLKEGFVVPPRTLVVGVPARVVREIGDEEHAEIIASADRYVVETARYREGS